MTSNMHCRTSYPTNDSTYSSSFLFVHSDYTNTLNQYNSPSSSYHDQIPPRRRRRRRRRLEDPVITYASNYYVTYSRQTSHSPPPPPSPSPQSPSFPSHHPIYQQSSSKDIYCDLFNLLECPPPVKQRRKYILSDYNLRCRHRSIDYKNSYTKVNKTNEQKSRQQPSYLNEKNHPEDKLSVTQEYDRLQEKSKTNNCIYQRHSSSKGFFRRVACNYFCMPMTVTNDEISS